MPAARNCDFVYLVGFVYTLMCFGYFRLLDWCAEANAMIQIAAIDPKALVIALL